MAKYIALLNWTELGVREIRDSPARADRARALARELGGDMPQLFMTMGTYDLVAILDMPDDEAMARFALASAASGHVRTCTLKAFDEDSYRRIVSAA